MCFKEKTQNATTVLYVDLQFKALLLCRCALKAESMSPVMPEMGVSGVQLNPQADVFTLFQLEGTEFVHHLLHTGTPKFFHLPASLN